MNLGGARLLEHLDQRSGRGSPDDGVVDHDEALALDVLLERVELAPNGLGTGLLVRIDEGAADVAVLDQALPEGDPGCQRESFGRRHPRVRHAHHHVGLDR